MARLNSFVFPEVPPDISEMLLGEDKTMIIIGVIGKSSSPDCNKIAGLQILNEYSTLASNSECKEGKITFYFEKGSKILYIHFETTYDNYVLQQVLNKSMNDSNLDHFINFNSYIRTRFARVLLFATQVCHLIVLVEPNDSFDASYLTLFKALKIIREKYVLKFLPKLLKNSNTGSFMGKEGRLCSPRFIFLFEKCPNRYTNDEEILKKLEFDVEDDIYKMLRNEFIITNNSSMSLFSIPRNKRFVFFNTDSEIRADPIMEAIDTLMNFINKSSNKEPNEDEFENIRPFPEFGKPITSYKIPTPSNGTKTERSLINLLKEHVHEALQFGFDDSIGKFRGKSHFVTPSTKAWFETFRMLHKIFIENPDNPKFEANDPDYKAYLENFHKIMDIDERFFTECCEEGLEFAQKHYREMLPHLYSRSFHEQKLNQSIDVYMKYARGPNVAENEIKLKNMCDTYWMGNKQQCEFPSLRGNPCVMGKHTVSDPTEHSSGVVYVSTCNCGRTQGRREDPYTIKQANFDFYQIMGNNCTACNKLEKITFPVFEPSINDFRAAKLLQGNEDETNMSENGDDSEISTPLTQHSHTNLSLNSMDDLNKIEYGSSDEESVNEIVLKVGETENNKDKMLRQPSTTEYLPGMVHIQSPTGLLPQFPSWSLVCIGGSSIYSHNIGLPEYFQSGFLSGSNFLLPWDVHVRLEHAASWAASYEKTRNRKKQQTAQTNVNTGSVFNLKIFVGYEYECPRGHRFIMTAPDKILRGGSGIIRDSGSKVVYNDMPLYFPCPCRTTKPSVAQLMRIHVVTPKAPVNVNLYPKIRVGSKNNLVFVSGLPEPAKLSQSAYWILRLPYIYHGDDGPITPPPEVTSSNTMLYGCLMAGMFGVTETESTESSIVM